MRRWSEVEAKVGRCSLRLALACLGKSARYEPAEEIYKNLKQPYVSGIEDPRVIGISKIPNQNSHLLNLTRNV